MSLVEQEEILLVDEPRVRPLREDPLVGVLTVVGTVVGLVLVQHFHLTGLIVVAVPAALVTVYIGVRRPLVALAVLQAVAWSGVSGVFGNHAGFSLYTGALVMGVVSLFLAIRREHVQPFGRSPIYLLVALVAFAQGLSLLLSPYPLGSFSTPISNLKDLIFFAVSLGLLRITKGYKVFVIAIVLTVVALA
ncbi:MAG: hypothetical protein M3256_26775, partial [Actinomycetota bacterium]|nr:hypothetical protein [Actinomycetota bacterium]